MMGDNVIRIHFEMLRARYDFTAIRPKTLSFEKNDYFILHSTATTEKNWWQVVNRLGQIGYVPSNYVSTVKVSPKFFQQFIDNCVGALNTSDNETSIASGQTSVEKEDLMLGLIEKRRQAELSFRENETHHLPLDLNNSAKTLDNLNHSKNMHSNINPMKGQGEGLINPSEKIGHNMKSSHRVEKEENLRSVKSEIKHVEKTGRSLSYDHSFDNTHKTVSSPDLSKSHSQITDMIHNRKMSDDPNSVLQPLAIYRLVDSVRQSTDLSFKLSKIAVATIVSELQDLLPGAVVPHLGGVLWHVQGPLEVPENLLLETFDAERLRKIFSELSACKDDDQQRTWMLHEDEITITEYISEMIQIFTNADNKICRLVMSQDDYECIVMLIQYYQMEVRWSIRQLLLKAFGVICNFDLIALRVMLASILPVELARDMTSNPKDVQRLRFSALLMTMIFSMGERMPYTHFDHIATDFILFLLKILHSPPDTDVEERLPDLCLNVILAYNLQFSISDSHNYVIAALEELNVMSTFTDKILLLLNRDEDPVRIFNHEPAPSHSVIKLFIDIFSKPASSQLFYTNDVRALIDIIVRQLSDLSPGDMKRHHYLELVRRVVRNTSYSEHMHRRDDLSRIFTRIFCEEGEASCSDQQLVREISNEFPQYFKA